MNKPKRIGDFELYSSTPNTISSKGALYIKEVHLDVPNIYKERKVRVYLPSCYEYNNPLKRFKVLYMMDGQNVFDKHTSYIEEWEADEIIESLIDDNKEGVIVVGIDSPKNDLDRTKEMLMESNGYSELYPNFKDGYASILGELIIKVIKPLIDKTFYTKMDKKDTGIGGASMGGLFAFYIGMKYHSLFSFALCFSPAFALYKSEHFKKELTQIKNPKEYGIIAFYNGFNDPLEQILYPLTKHTYDYLKEIGFDDKQLRFFFDKEGEHNEVFWRIYFKKALNIWLSK